MIISDIHKSSNDQHRTALNFHGLKVDYTQLEDRVEQYARYFTSMGLQPGERVAIAMTNCPEFVYSYLGTVRAGGIAVPLNLLQAPQELIYILEDSGARFLITSTEIDRRIKQLPKLPVNLIVLDEKTQKEIPDAPATRFPEIDGDEVCTFLYTSGTTGQPKGVMLTHANLLSNVKDMEEVSHFGHEDNFLAVLPMFHSFGWATCVLLPLYLGGTVTALDSFRPKEMLEVLSREGITIFCGVPSMFAVLLKLRRQATFPRLRFAFSGGDSISGEHIVAFEEKFNVKIIEGYGMSEASPILCLNPIYGNRKIKSIGVALPNVETKVINDAGLELPAGEVGELVARGPNIMKGYYNREEETRAALKDGWLYTGDLVYKDEDGYFFVAGRKKELIITAGFNVYPREVEAALEAHPSVSEAAVIGVPHPLKGQEVKAFVVPQEGQSPDKQELLRFLRGRLANYKLPEKVVFTGDLPRGANGKILKRLLQ